jgi:hypothetical protein
MTTDLRVSAICLRGPDTGNLRVSVPGGADVQDAMARYGGSSAICRSPTGCRSFPSSTARTRARRRSTWSATRTAARPTSRVARGAREGRTLAEKPPALRGRADDGENRPADRSRSLVPEDRCEITQARRCVTALRRVVQGGARPDRRGIREGVRPGRSDRAAGIQRHGVAGLPRRARRAASLHELRLSDALRR